MLTRKQLLLFLPLLYAPFAVHAGNMQLDVNASITFLDAGGDDNFESGRTISVFFDYQLKPWLALDAGLLFSDKAQDEVRSDVVGTYQASIETQSIMLGVKPQYKFDGPFEIYGRLGFLFWDTELEVEEYFGTGFPSGTATAHDRGYGYYVNFGAAHNITTKVSVQLELSHMKQQDVFEGQSSYPFDLTINSIGIGIGYRF